MLGEEISPAGEGGARSMWWFSHQAPGFLAPLETELGLRKSGKRDFVAEWQQLMHLWESAFASYAAICESRLVPHDARGTIQPAESEIEQARFNLITIKQQIDDLISAAGRTRAASPDPLRFAFLDTRTKRLVDATSAGSSASSDQVAAKSDKP